MQTIVYKLGGGLLDLPDLHTRLQSVIEDDLPCHPLVVVGGGEAANIVRDWDRQFELSASQSHWLAIAAMQMNSLLLKQLLPSGQLIESREQVNRCWHNDQISILDVEQILRSESNARDDALPENWDVTSDSIAAWVAKHWPADRLVLLKSIDPPTSQSEILDGAVDSHFPKVAESIHNIEWINFRKAPHKRKPFSLENQPT